ncbi:hypothetical protein ABBQ32_007958 [Trebouxia sp. C0010 RCD-2024]
MPDAAGQNKHVGNAMDKPASSQKENSQQSAHSMCSQCSLCSKCCAPSVFRLISAVHGVASESLATDIRQDSAVGHLRWLPCLISVHHIARSTNLHLLYN